MKKMFIVMIVALMILVQGCTGETVKVSSDGVSVEESETTIYQNEMIESGYKYVKVTVKDGFISVYGYGFMAEKDLDSFLNNESKNVKFFDEENKGEFIIVSLDTIKYIETKNIDK